MRSACWVLGALTPGSVARPLHPEPHARVTRNNPPLSTQNPPLLGFNFFLNFLLAQRSFSFLYFRSWRCFLQTAYIWIQASLPGPAAAEPRKPGGSHEQAGAAREKTDQARQARQTTLIKDQDARGGPGDPESSGKGVWARSTQNMSPGNEN